MGQLEKLEMTLDEWLRKKAPFQIPDNGRKVIAGALWWLVLIFGALQLLAAWGLWHAGRTTDGLVEYANELSVAYGGDPVTSLGFIYYLTLIVLLVDAVLMLLASTGLKAMQKAGWNLLFYSLLLNAVYGVFVAFTDFGNVSDLFGSLIGSIVGGYLLFQVRDRFSKAPVVHKSAK